MTGSDPGPGRGPDPAAGGTRWLDAGEQAVWRAFLDVSRLLVDDLGRRLTRDGLTLPEYEVLVHLSEAAGDPARSLRMADLAERAVSSRSRLSHTVARLEERGLVRREACPDDGRGVLCVLTDAGLALLAGAAPAHVEAVRSLLFDPLAPGDAEALGRAMTAVRTALRAP